MPDRFACLIEYGTPTEASMIVGFLEAHGIVAFPEGGAIANWYNHMGIALASVRVMVPTESFEAASKLLHSVKEHSSAAWYCKACEEEVDAGFELCWSCGKPREEVHGEPTLQDVDSQAGQSSIPHDFCDKTVISLDTSGNAYAPPRNQSTRISPRIVREEESNESDELVLRAWRSMLIAFIFPIPFVLNLYSIFLLSQVETFSSELLSRSRRRYALTWIGNLVGGAVWGIYFVHLV